MKLHLLALSAVLAARGTASAETSATALSLVEAQRCKAAAEYSKAARGVAVLVMRRGEIIFEDYAPIWNASKPHLLASGTKSICGVLAACAAQDRILNLDEKVSDTLVEWKDGGLKSRATIRQLLNLSSGIHGGENNESVPSYAKAVELATAIPNAEIGEEFSYGPIPFQCFGELLRRKLAPKGETVHAYLTRRIIAPLKLRIVFWRRDKDSNPHLSSGAFLTARDWARFGELVRQNGKWNGTQLVDAEALAECRKPSPGNPAYGLGWWLLGRDEAGSSALVDGRDVEHPKSGYRPPPDTLAAMGKGKQRCYIIPSLEMVIVRMGDSENREFSDDEFLARLLGK